MYNLEIGRRLLALYNEDKPRKLTAKEFFDEVMFPVFFDVDDDAHFMPGGNSAFGQSSYAKLQRGDLTLPQYRKKRFETDIKAVATGTKRLSYSTAPAFSADGPNQTTAGQVSDLRYAIDEDIIYCAWIGAACGLCLKGGINIVIDHPKLLLHTIEGWRYYRIFLKNNTTYKARQLETWNSLWMVYALNAASHEEGLLNINDRLQEHGKNLGDKFEFSNRPTWFQLFFDLSLTDLPRHLTAWVYQLGSTNSSLGFMSVDLQCVTRYSGIFHKLLGDLFSYDAANAILRQHFEAEYNLQKLAERGGISIRTLRPAKVEAFMKAAKPQKTDDNPHYSILIKSWIIAMLNNDQLADLARDLGLALRDIEVNSRENATTKIEALLNAGSKTAFIVAANELKEHKGVIDAKEPVKKEILDAAVQVIKRAEDAAQRQIPIDQLPLFRALAKSDYLMAKHFAAPKPAQLS